MSAPRTDAATNERRRAASWVDAIAAGVDRLPGPAWVAYLALAVGLVAIEAGIAAASAADLTPFMAYYAAAGIYALAVIHHLQRAAGPAFDRVAPDLEIEPDGTAELRRALTSLPAGPTAAASGVAVVIAVGVLAAGGPIEEQLAAAGLPPGDASVAVNLGLYVLNWAATGALLFRIAHQSRRIVATFRRARIDLYDQARLHGLSWLHAWSVIGLAVMFYAPIILVGALESAAWTLVRIAVAVILAALFVWPLRDIHRLLAAEQGRLLSRSMGRTKAFYEDLHGRLAAGTSGVVDVIRNEIDTLEREQRMLRSLPTWPWAPAAVPTVMGAIVLPLIFSVLVTLVRQVLPA